MRVKEVWAEEATAYASLWRYLLDLDLARTFKLWSAPLDEPLRHLVTDARAVETSITDNLYLRVVDVEAALRARKYAAGVDLVIEVDDPILPANSGRYRLVTDGDPGGRERRGDPRRRRSPTSRWESSSSAPSTSAAWPSPHLHRVGRVVRAHPRRRRGRLDRLRVAPGAVLPGHVLVPRVESHDTSLRTPGTQLAAFVVTRRSAATTFIPPPCDART